MRTRTAPGPSSQVLPGCRVRHPLCSKKILLRADYGLLLRIADNYCGFHTPTADCGLILRIADSYCGVTPNAEVSRLLKITGLFCKRGLQKRLYSAKETYNLKEPPTVASLHQSLIVIKLLLQSAATAVLGHTQK